MQRIKFIVVSALGLALLAGLTGTGTAGLPYKSTWTIFVTSDREGKDADIYGMNVNGTNVRTLTSSPKFDGGGVLSPNGRKSSSTASARRTETSG